MSTIMPEHTPDQLRFQIEHMVETLVGRVRWAQQMQRHADTMMRTRRKDKTYWHMERDEWRTLEAHMRELAWVMRVGDEFENMLTECEYHDRQREQEGV